MNWILVIVVAILLVAADKTITAMTIKQVQKNHPAADPYSAEKNQLAKLFFQKFGLIGGSVVYGIISVGTFILAMWLLTQFFGTHNFYPWFIILMIYGYTLVNNVYYYIRYS